MNKHSEFRGNYDISRLWEEITSPGDVISVVSARYAEAEAMMREAKKLLQLVGIAEINRW